MKRILLLLIYLQVTATCFSQNERKEIDLTTAIMEGYRSLAPVDISGFLWLKDNRFLHYGENDDVVVKDIEGDTLEYFSRATLNFQLIEQGLDTLFAVSVRGVLGDDVYLRAGDRLVKTSLSGRSIEEVLTYPDGAENLTHHLESGQVIYTKGPNVFLISPNITERQITTHKKESMVSAGIGIHRFEFGIRNGLFWSGNGEKFAFYEMDESEVTDYPLANYGETPAASLPIKYPMAGQASHSARVGIHDVLRDTTYYLKVEGPSDQYLTNFTFSPDGNTAYLAIVNRAQNEMNLNSYDANTGDYIETLFSETHEKYVEPERPPLFLKDGRFLWFSERDGFDHLYLHSSKGKLLKQVTKGDFDVLSYYGELDGSILLKTTRGTMNDRLVLVDLKSGKERELTNNEGTYDVAFNESTGLMKINERSMTVANRAYILNPKGKSVLDLVDDEDPLNDYQLGDIELPVLQANDGTELQARLIKPSDFDPSKKYPVLVYVYGGPHVQLIRNNRTAGAPLWMFHAANRGYVVFTVDGRGSANRGLQFEQATHRQLGTIELEDQLVGVEYLKTLPYVDTDKMAIHGWSFGGFMTTSMMLRYPGVFDVGVAGGPVTDWDLYEIMYTERYMDTPEENPEGYEKADLKQYTKDLEGKLLLIHGLDDDIVVPQHSYTLLESFVDEGVQVDFFVYPGHPHNVRGKDRIHLMQKVLNYIDLHISE